VRGKGDSQERGLGGPPAEMAACAQRLHTRGSPSTREVTTLCLLIVVSLFPSMRGEGSGAHDPATGGPEGDADATNEVRLVIAEPLERFVFDNPGEVQVLALVDG